MAPIRLNKHDIQRTADVKEKISVLFTMCSAQAFSNVFFSQSKKSEFLSIINVH